MTQSGSNEPLVKLETEGKQIGLVSDQYKWSDKRGEWFVLATSFRFAKIFCFRGKFLFLSKVFVCALSCFFLQKFLFSQTVSVLLRKKTKPGLPVLYCNK
jgi:hypothetical protein